MMKFTAILFLFALAVTSHQQLQRPRGVIWLAPYYSRPQPANGWLGNQAAHYYNDAPYINQQFAKGQLLSQDNLDENEDYQSRIIGSFGQQQQNNARFFFNSNPFNFGAMSAPVVMSMVTTIASIVTCVPPFNFLAGAAPPACSGRKRRNSNDAEDTQQFSIFPSKTLKFLPTALPPALNLKREKRLSIPNIDQEIHESIVSSKDDMTNGDMSKADQINLRERRFFFNNNAATSISTSYVFVPTVLTNQINLVVPAPSAQCDDVAAADGSIAKPCAPCLPPGYIVCPPA